MRPTREQILTEFLKVIHSMNEEWGDTSVVSEDSFIMGDLNWRSIQIVYLVNVLQERFGQTFPLAEFLERIEQRETKDVTVREWVDFIHENLEDEVFPTASAEVA